MTFTWPWALLGLVAVPALGMTWARLRAARQARRAALARQGLVSRDGRLGDSGHGDRGPGGARLALVGPLLVLAALGVLVVALARPVAAVAEPRREGTVVLAFDVSTSMAATDVRPSRLGAAQAAARRFVAQQPASVRIGVVAFGGSGVVTQRPTTDRTDVVAAIDRLRADGQTSLGGGMLAALGAIAGRPVLLPPDAESGTAPGPGTTGPGTTGPGTAKSAVGYYGGTAIVLLTDGENTGGPDPQQVADLTSTAGVRIDPIGLGTPEGTVLQIDGFSVATALDEQTLRQIAATTGGTYRSATDAASLGAVYDSIELAWHVQTVPHEVTSLVAGLGALLLLAGVGTTLVREGRVI